MVQRMEKQEQTGSLGSSTRGWVPEQITIPEDLNHFISLMRLDVQPLSWWGFFLSFGLGWLNYSWFIGGRWWWKWKWRRPERGSKKTGTKILILAFSLEQWPTLSSQHLLQLAVLMILFLPFHPLHRIILHCLLSICVHFLSPCPHHPSTTVFLTGRTALLSIIPLSWHTFQEYTL